MGPNAVIVREEPAAAGPTRRTVYEPRDDGRWQRRVELWRAAIDGWHTTEEGVVDRLAIEGEP